MNARVKEIYLTISFIRGLNNSGYYIELSGMDEAGFEIRDEDSAEEKVNTMGHEMVHLILEYFLPNLPSKRRRLCLTEKEEDSLCRKAGEFFELLLKPYLKGYFRDYGKQETDIKVTQG